MIMDRNECLQHQHWTSNGGGGVAVYTQTRCMVASTGTHEILLGECGVCVCAAIGDAQQPCL